MAAKAGSTRGWQALVFVLLACTLGLTGCTTPFGGASSTPQHKLDTALTRLLDQPHFTLTESYSYLDASDAVGRLTLAYNRPDRYRLDEHLLSPTQRPYLLGSWARVGKDECHALNNDTDTYLCSETKTPDVQQMVHDILLPRGAALSTLQDADPASNGLQHEAFRMPKAGSGAATQPSVITVDATGYPWPCNPLITCTGQPLDGIHYQGAFTIDAHTSLPQTYEATALPGPQNVLDTGDVQDVAFRYGLTSRVVLPAGKRVTCPFPQAGGKQWCIRVTG